MFLETTYTYIQRELTRLIQVAEKHGMTDLAHRLLLAKDALRVEHHTEVKT